MIDKLLRYFGLLIFGLVCVFGLFALILSFQQTKLWSEEAAGWAQAFGAMIALTISIWLPYSNEKKAYLREVDLEKSFLQAVDRELIGFWFDDDIVKIHERILNLCEGEYLMGEFIEPHSGYSSLLNMSPNIVAVRNQQLLNTLLEANWRLKEYYSCIIARNNALRKFVQFVEDQALMNNRSDLVKLIEKSRHHDVVTRDRALRSITIQMIALAKDLHQSIDRHVNGE